MLLGNICDEMPKRHFFHDLPAIRDSTGNLNMEFPAASLRFILILTPFALVCGCSWVGNTVKSELSAYAEPTDGPLAHVRLIGSRDVKVYPASTCVSVGVVGGGYPAGPQLGGQRKRDLGMPKLPGTPRHFVEIAARSGEPLTMAFSFYQASYSGGYAGASAPEQNSSHCHVGHSFVPEAGGQYEAVARWAGRRCSIDVVRLVRDAASGLWTRISVPSSPAPTCSSASSIRWKEQPRPQMVPSDVVAQGFTVLDL